VTQNKAGVKRCKIRLNSPEDICRLFTQYMQEGDIEKVLSVYDAECVFLNRSGETRRGKEQLRQELAPFAAAKTVFDFEINQVVRAGDIALMHTRWNISAPQQCHCMRSRLHVGKRMVRGAG
jgi:uncharacterized protein (TIGR02246 family)